MVWAENGQKGVELFGKSKPNEFDAILMDIRMPVMNGLEATKAIRALSHQNAKNIAIIAMTANAYEEDVRECMQAGMNCHIAKPIEPNILFETLTYYI